MPRTARLLAVGALLTVMSLGTSAYAQTAGAEPQPPAATPSAPSTQPSGDPAPQPPASPSPGPATPAPAPASTTSTTRPPVVRPKSLPVTVSPRAGSPGTPVRVVASVGRCSRVYVWFYDSKADGVTEAGGARRVAAVRVTTDGTLFASYTLTSKVAAGPGRFSVVCGFEDGTARSGVTGFRVLAPGAAGSAGSRGSSAGTGGSPAGGAGPGTQSAGNPDQPVQFPDEVDTGLGGITDAAGQGRPSSLLLPAAGLLLVALAGGLWLGHTMARRRS